MEIEKHLKNLINAFYPRFDAVDKYAQTGYDKEFESWPPSMQQAALDIYHKFKEGAGFLEKQFEEVRNRQNEHLTTLKSIATSLQSLERILTYEPDGSGYVEAKKDFEEAKKDMEESGEKKRKKKRKQG
jgi:hypothetical protein